MSSVIGSPIVLVSWTEPRPSSSPGWPPSTPPTPLSASVISLGKKNILFASPSEILGNACRYW